MADPTKPTKPFQISHPGRLRALAGRQGTTVKQVARTHAGDAGSLGAAARLYLNVFDPANRKRKAR